MVTELLDAAILVTLAGRRTGERVFSLPDGIKRAGGRLMAFLGGRQVPYATKPSRSRARADRIVGGYQANAMDLLTALPASAELIDT